MQVAKPAVLKPGVTVESLPGPRDSDLAIVDAAAAPLIRGKALMIWDPKNPSKKLDAIDTDQITPAADCVSESLDTLDERWKAGSFRYLMPDFRARVHRGETFVIAGDRFAIGSSREMSPAGLKAIAEEVGLEMVIICGNNMGDIFRRNSFNLGLHVVQSPEAVADARDGDEFTFDPVSRQIVNVTQGKTYDAGAAERQGRRDPPERRHLRRRPARVPRVGRAPAGDRVSRSPSARARCRRPRRSSGRIASTRTREVAPGATLRVYADLLPASDGTAPFSIHTFNQITGGNSIYPRQAAVANDHFVFTGKKDDDKQTAIGAQFAAFHGIEKPYYATPGDGIFHFYFPEQGLVLPGQFIPGADSHSRAYGAYGAVGMGVGSTTLGFGWSTGYIYFTMAQRAPRDVPRQAEPLGHRQGHRPRAVAPMGSEAVAGHVGGAGGRRQAAADRVSQHHREHDGGGGSAERHLRAGRDHLRVVSRQGHRRAAVSAFWHAGRTRASRSTRNSISPTSRR